MVQPIQKIWNPNTLQWEQIAPTKEEFDDALNEIDVLSQNVNSHLSDYVLQVPYAEATGSANTYAVTLNPIPSAYVDGMAIAVKINVNNTGASTININGLGAKTIKKPNGNDVSAGNLKAGSIYSMRYNGTNFILQGSDAAGNATPGDVISGKTFSNDEGDQTGTLELTGDAVAANVLSGKTFYNTNPKSKISGSMTNRGAVTITPGATNKAIAAGYHNGSGYVVGDANLVAANIKSGVEIFGVAGSIPYPPVVQTGTASFSLAVGGHKDFSVGFTPDTVILYGISSDYDKETMYVYYGFSGYFSMFNINTDLGILSQITNGFRITNTGTGEWASVFQYLAIK